MVDFTIYEVGPRDGLQNCKIEFTTAEKVDLVGQLLNAGLTNIEVTSFVHPKMVPQMADAEDVFTQTNTLGGNLGVLVPNEKGLQRAKDVGAYQFNIFYSPSEAFNQRNLGVSREQAVAKYRSMLWGIPRSNIRVYLSCFFGCPFEGEISTELQRECVQEASLLGDTVVLCDTIGVATHIDIQNACNHRFEIRGGLALHLHHGPGREPHTLSLVREAIEGGITQIDSSIGGLGGCPFMPNSGGNLATEALVSWAEIRGLDCGVRFRDVEPVAEWLRRKRLQQHMMVS